MKSKITKDMMLAEIVEKYPQAAEALMTKYGLHCLGCFAAEMETLEQGAAAHGMSDKKIETMITALNKLVEK